MIDEKYPGFDVNSLIPISDFFQQVIVLKLFDAGFGYIHHLQNTSLDELKLQAKLSDAEYQEIEKVLSMFSRQDESK